MNDAAIDPLFADYTGNVPGAAVAVVRDGVVLFHKGYGLGDLASRAPITTSTNFRLASVTKQFTATAIEILAERGKLSYDDPIVKWLPSLPSYAGPITIRHLLTHTSGLIDYEDLIPKSQTEQVNDADVLHLLEQTDHLYFAPGSKYQYSNTAYVFLGLIVERVTGESLGAFMKREIFDRAGMHNTVLMDAGVTIANRSFGHTRVDGKWERRDQSVTSATRGDGAIYSNAGDLAMWANALQNATIVSRDTITRVFTPAVTTAPGASYGFGWFIGTHDGRAITWHTGETVSFHNAILRVPDEKLAIVVLTNRDDGDPLAIAKKIADLTRR